MLILFHRIRLHTDIFFLLIFPSITNRIMYFKMYADEMYLVIEIKSYTSSPWGAYIERPKLDITPHLEAPLLIFPRGFLLQSFPQGDISVR